MTTPKAGREMDAQVAEKVMGATWRDSDSVDRAVCTMRKMCGRPKRALVLAGRVMCWQSVSGAMLIPDDGPHDTLPHYSTDIAAAWLVVEKLRADGWDFNFDHDVGRSAHALFTRRPILSDCLFEQYADTAPLAICKAALAACAPLVHGSGT